MATKTTIPAQRYVEASTGAHLEERLGLQTSEPARAIKAAKATKPTEAVATSKALHRYAWVVVGYNVLVVLWGAVVRSTGSGDGCGEHWPLCGGTMVQHWKTLASVIEYAHRASVGVAVIALLGLVVWTWQATMRRHLARVLVAASVVLTCNEAFLGALLVLKGLTAQNHSPARALYLSLHLANTLVLLATLALTAHFLGRTDARMRGGVALRGGWGAALGLLATLSVGVTGSLAALGDTLYPAASLRAAFAQDFASGGSWLLHIRWLHPALSVVAALCIGILLWRSRHAQEAATRTLGGVVVGLIVLQMVLGVADVLLLAPTWIQITHLFGADLLWISLVVLAARLCIRPLGCTGGGCQA
jgi:cytochrome c oxidase assembly protein subunit 15